MASKSTHFLVGARVSMALWGFGVWVPVGMAWAQGVSVAVVTVSAATRELGSFDIEGTVQAVRQATVAAQVSGNLLALAVKAGDVVKAGQVLARLDDRDAAAGVARADAGVAQADAEWRNARTVAERNRDLKSKGFVSQAALDQAEVQLNVAQAGLRQAREARTQAALARGYANVSAPFDGVVLATLLDVGDLASPGRAVLTMYAPGALRAVVQVPASRAEVARRATAQRVLLLGAPTWMKPLRTTELPLTDPVAQTVEWRLDLPADAAVTPGRSVTVRFDAGGAAAGPAARPLASVTPTVPEAAVLRRGELEAVYVVTDHRFVLRAVRLGAATAGSAVEVLAGLKPGDVVAADAVRAGLGNASPAAVR